MENGVEEEEEKKDEKINFSKSQQSTKKKNTMMIKHSSRVNINSFKKNIYYHFYKVCRSCFTPTLRPTNFKLGGSIKLRKSIHGGSKNLGSGQVSRDETVPRRKARFKGNLAPPLADKRGEREKRKASRRASQFLAAT